MPSKKPAPKTKGSNSSRKTADNSSDEDSDAANDEELARKLHAEENRTSMRAVKKAPVENSMYSREMVLSPDLAAVVGGEKMPRSEVVKRMWAVIKERKLQDPSDKQYIICDEQLMKVFVWDGAILVQYDKLQRIQNRVGKLILKAPYRTPSVEILSRLGWKTVKTIHQQQKALLVYKALRNALPPYMRRVFSLRRDEVARNTRSASTDCLIPPRPHLEAYRRSLAYSGSVVWNNIQPHIRAAPSIHTFKSLMEQT
ncbi:hypothetical protein Bbelb_295190 [Branchiostoma belcheri]|nr:hypothetical protein Bbelb_295190 [Branchiostoma belcheri]